MAQEEETWVSVASGLQTSAVDLLHGALVEVTLSPPPSTPAEFDSYLKISNYLQQIKKLCAPHQSREEHRPGAQSSQVDLQKVEAPVAEEPPESGIDPMPVPGEQTKPKVQVKGTVTKNGQQQCEHNEQ